MRINQGRTNFQGVYVVVGKEKEVDKLTNHLKTKTSTPITTEKFVNSSQRNKKTFGQADCAGVIATGFDSIILSKAKGKENYPAYKTFLNETIDKAIEKCSPFIKHTFEVKNVDVPVFDAIETLECCEETGLPLDGIFQDEYYIDKIGNLKEIQQSSFEITA